MNNKPVIIHLVNSNIYSGLEKVVIDIIEALKDKFEFYYACKDGPILEILREKNIKRIKINKICKKELIRIEKEYKPNLIHAHDYTATLFCGLFIKKTMIISHLHNNSPWIKKFLHPYSWAFLIATKNKKINKILTVSDSIEKEYIFSKYIKNKIEMIGNPISVQKITSQVPSNLNKIYDICFVGRLTEQKNPIGFINIINEIKKEIPNIKAIMLGDGELRKKCENLVNELNLTRNIEIIGFRKNVYTYMAQSKVFCLPSKWEGFGLVTFEALSLGLPCIVSNVGGLPGIVNDNCGKLCNNNEEYVQEIILLLKNDLEYSKKKLQALDNAKKLDNSNSYYKNLEIIYRKTGEIC